MTMAAPTRRKLPELVIRPEFEATDLQDAQIGDVARRLSPIERIWNNNGFRKALILLSLVAAWQTYTVVDDVEPLMFPRFTVALEALYQALFHGELISQIWYSVKVLFMGYGAGMAIAAVLVLWATVSRIGSDFIAMSSAMFNPLPAIALLPLATLWFELGTASLVFVLVHSVLWAVALSTHTGFLNVSQTLRMIGRNYGLRGIGFVVKILVPAAFPSILAGMKIGWAFAWRTLIGAELVFGASSGSGGLGWFIFIGNQEFETEKVFAGLFMVILIGILVENVIFRNVELRTVNRWGMQR
ncbi:MAG: ABC transporter permease subunit [Hyphomicrobiales bacterium]|nr:ABC transporter permease subunit [Hyphomicrobiales bacterium]